MRLKFPKLWLGKMMEVYGKKGKFFWKGEFKQSDKIYISTPEQWEAELIVGNTEVFRESKNTFDLGNAIFSYSPKKYEKWIDIEVKVSNAKETRQYVLGRIYVKECFLTQPKFEYKDGSLYWNRGKRLIGDNGGDIKLIINGFGLEREYPLDLTSSVAVDRIDIPHGEYKFRIIKEVEKLFSVSNEQTDISEGSLVIGDKHALRFRDSRIRITGITNDDKFCEILKTYIEHIEYQGFEYVDSENRKCPIYKGIMFYADKSNNYYKFSNEEKETDIGYKFYKVNPVKIVYIDDHILSIKNEHDQGLYYYRHKNNKEMRNEYRLTDREPSRENKSRYCTADLYTYEKERIDNV